MEKVKLEFVIPSNKEVEYNGVKFEITPFLTITQQAGLINQYLADYFTREENSLVFYSEYNYLESELNLINRIVKTLTNLDDESLPIDIYVDAQFTDKIKSNIVNFKEFRDRLNTIIYEMKEQKALANSIGKVLGDLVEKAYTVLDKYADLDPKEIDAMQEKSLELIKELKDKEAEAK